MLRLGIAPLNPGQWLVASADLADFHRHKLHCHRNHRDKTVLALPGSAAAQRECRELILQHLSTDHAGIYRCGDTVLEHAGSGLTWSLDDPSLWAASLWVSEDICVLEESGSDYLLTAASVCSPSNWCLEDKIGRNLDVIHGPVPGYDTTLSTRVNRLFHSLKVDKPLLRFNWSVQNDCELLWRKDLNSGVAGSARYWRVERQTLRRLPRSGAIVFSIGISLHSFTRMAAYPGFNSAIEALLAQLPAEQKHYKGLD